MPFHLFSDVLEDNLSGSGDVLRKVQQELLGVPPDTSFETATILGLLQQVEAQFPHFALLFHFIRFLRNTLKDKVVVTGKELSGRVEDYVLHWENAQQQAAENLIRTVSLEQKQILLHSNSSAIHRLFSLLSERRIFPVVWQTVSSPAGEGVKQAERLHRMGFQVHLFHEDAVSKFMDRLDLAVFGADLLWAEGFLNKTGSYPLALMCRRFGKPVYVLAESRKKVDAAQTGKERFEQFLQEDLKPPVELVAGQTALQVHNYYFEAVPLSLVSRVFMENTGNIPENKR